MYVLSFDLLYKQQELSVQQSKINVFEGKYAVLWTPFKFNRIPKANLALCQLAKDFLRASSHITYLSRN